jgi:hypothetical protein
MQELSHNKLVIGWPDGWHDRSNVILVGPSNDGFAPSINITCQRLTKPLSAEEYAGEQQSQLEKALDDEKFRVLDKGPYSLGTRPAYQRTQSYCPPALNREVVQWQVHIVNGLNAAVITATDKASTFERNLPLFKAAIAEFKWQ